MDMTFKIEKGQINKLAFKDIRNKSIVGLATIIFIFSSLTVMIKSANVMSNPNNLNNIIFFSASITIVFMVFITWNAYNFKKIFYSNYLIEINDTIISKHISIENSKLSELNAMNWKKAKRLYPQNNISIEWKKIAKIEEKRFGLCLKTESANNFFGSGQVVIPREIENYNELKQIINEKINTTANLL